MLNGIVTVISLLDGDMAIVYYYFIDTKMVLIQVPERAFHYSNHSVLYSETFSQNQKALTENLFECAFFQCMWKGINSF